MFSLLAALLFGLLAMPVGAVETLSWSRVDALLQDAVGKSVFPGAVALIADSSGVLHTSTVGRQTYSPEAPPMTESTLFDLASLTKVVSTTTAAMILYQEGLIQLETPLTSYFGPEYAAIDSRKANTTILNLLLHNAGFPPDPTPVSFCAPSFGCPEVKVQPPSARKLTFSCQSKALSQLYGQTLDKSPGEQYVYSDISMISMMFVIGNIVRAHSIVKLEELDAECVRHIKSDGSMPTKSALIAGIDQCYYEAFVRTRVFSRLIEKEAHFMGFRPPERLWKDAAPTWNDTTAGFPGECVVPFRERVLQGEVSDGNAYALGGVAGHAGLFASISELHNFAHQILFAPFQTEVAGSQLGINQTTTKLFTTIHNASQSSRALGWDTNDYVANTYRGCGNLSQATFTHTGYTGTQICADPSTKSGLITILLTNRVYPDADVESLKKIHATRQAFNNEVLNVLGVYDTTRL